MNCGNMRPPSITADPNNISEAGFLVLNREAGTSERLYEITQEFLWFLSVSPMNVFASKITGAGFLALQCLTQDNVFGSLLACLWMSLLVVKRRRHWTLRTRFIAYLYDRYDVCRWIAFNRGFDGSEKIWIAFVTTSSLVFFSLSTSLNCL